MTLNSTLKASGNSLICRCGPPVVVVVVVVNVVGVSSSAPIISGYMASPLTFGSPPTYLSISSDSSGNILSHNRANSWKWRV
uniref:Uncharacterized protein n=1 Tax=Tanacetum cinerariifolium TaxID=118510 RepID=A0A699UJU2_TANCI|nr:hypothetical protein [Tanacetum cinerariifolium]